MVPDKNAERLELLLEVGRLLSSKLELEELLTSVMGLSANVVDAETASLLLLEEKSQSLYFDVALGLGEEASKMRLPLGQGIAGCVAQSRKPEIINDVRADPRWSPRMDEQSGFVTRSILAVPMMLKGKLVGVVEAINKRSGAFTPDDLKTLEAFASQASVAIDNARLFSSVRDERRKLNTVFTEMTDGAVLADAQGSILLANEAAWKFLGSGTELSSLAEALKGMAVTPPLAQILEGSQSCDFTAVREQPKPLILAGRATRIALSRGAKDEVPGWLHVFRDVTEESQKLKIKRTFLSLISHKLKTPLASVTGFAEILIDELKDDPPSPVSLKAAQTIASQGNKLALLVDKLLRFTTLESPETKVELVPCPIDTVIGEALRVMKEWLAENKASVVFEPAGVSVTGDRRFLGDVVRNLIENAVKFADKPEKKVAVWVEAKDGMVLVSVSDNGPGIPPEDQERIFSRFHQVEASFTGQVEGWGLGLPFVKKVADLHGGSVHLLSKLGEGTTVTISLPRSLG